MNRILPIGADASSLLVAAAGARHLAQTFFDRGTAGDLHAFAKTLEQDAGELEAKRGKAARPVSIRGRRRRGELPA